MKKIVVEVFDKKIINRVKDLGCDYKFIPPNAICVFSNNGNKLPDLFHLLLSLGAEVANGMLVYTAIDRGQYLVIRKQISECAESLGSYCLMCGGVIKFGPSSDLSRLFSSLIAFRYA